MHTSRRRAADSVTAQSNMRMKQEAIKKAMNATKWPQVQTNNESAHACIRWHSLSIGSSFKIILVRKRHVSGHCQCPRTKQPVAGIEQPGTDSIYARGQLQCRTQQGSALVCHEQSTLRSELHLNAQIHVHRMGFQGVHAGGLLHSSRQHLERETHAAKSVHRENLHDPDDLGIGHCRGIQALDPGLHARELLL